MKKLITILILSLIAITSYAQDVIGTRVIARQSLFLRNRWVDSIRVDTVGLSGDNGSLMTSGAIYKFVSNRIGGGGGGGSGTVTNIATGLGLSGGPITTTGTILVDTANASILSRQRAAATYALIGSVESPFLPVTGTGTATGNIIGALGSNTLTIGGGDNVLLINPPTFTSTLAAGDGTASSSIALNGDLVGTTVNFSLATNNGTNNVGITGNAITNTLTYTADTHIFNGTVEGVGIDDVLAEEQALTADREIDLGGHTYEYENGNWYVDIGDDYIAYIQNGDENYLGYFSNANSYVRSFNGVTVNKFTQITAATDDDKANYLLVSDYNGAANTTYIEGKSEAGEVNLTLRADFDNGTKEAEIKAFADATSSTFEHTADTHTFNGAVRLAALAGNGTGVVAVDNDGDLSWVATPSGGGLTIGTTTITSGTNTRVLFNNSGVVGEYTITGTGNVAMSAAPSMSSITLAAGTATAGTAPLYLTAGTNLTAPVSGALEFDGNVFYKTTLSGRGVSPSVMFASQTSTNTLSDVNTVQPVFASGFDVFTLQATTSYFFEGMYSISHGAASHSIGMSFELGGGASVTSIAYTTTCWVTAIGTNTASQTTNFIAVTTNTAVNAAGSNGIENIYFSGIIRVNAGGTVQPSITFSSPPGGAPVTNINSFIRFTTIGVNTVNSVGNVQ